jgi:hypothetical protein
MAHQLKAAVLKQVGNVLSPAREEVIHAQHFVATLQQRFAQMGTQKAGAAGNQYSVHAVSDSCESMLF